MIGPYGWMFIFWGVLLSALGTPIWLALPLAWLIIALL